MGNNDRLLNLAEAVEALGAMPSGYCFCRENRDPDKADHEPECADLRRTLAAAQSGVYAGVTIRQRWMMAIVSGNLESLQQEHVRFYGNEANPEQLSARIGELADACIT